MKNKIERLSEILLNENGLFNQTHYIDLCNVNIVDFLIHNFSVYAPSHVLRILIIYNRILKNVTLGDWLNIFSSIKNSEMAILTCVRFLYQFIGINSLNIVDRYREFNPELIERVKCYLDESRRLIIPDKWTMSLISSLEGNVEVFKDIHNKLIEEGAPSSGGPFIWNL